MLQFIRDRATGWIAWGIVVLISIPFALWGINDFLGYGQAPAVAEVNGTELSVGQYNLAYQRHRQRLQQLLGASFNVNQLDEGTLRQQSLESMIQDELLVQSGDDDRMKISDQQLARAIQVQAPFQLDGEFDQGLYESWLRSQGYSSGGFEFDLRRNLLIEQILSGVGGSAIAADREKSRMVELQGQTRSFSELTLPIGRGADIEIDESEIESQYEANMAQLMTNEEVTLEYVIVSLDQMASDIDVDESDLRSYYESRKLTYVEPERRQAAHILIRVPQDADEAAVELATSTVSELKGKLDSGESFAELAKQYSQDPGSAARGGELGYFERGIMDPAFETAVFSMHKGEISDPVRSTFGLHLIELQDVVEGSVKSFEDAHIEVLDEYQRREAEKNYYGQVENLANLVFEVPDTLEVAAEELDLEIHRVSGVGRQGRADNRIASEPRVVQAAYSDDVLVGGNNSDVIELPDNQAVVVRVAEHEQSRQQTLAEARNQIVQQLQAERAREEALAAGEAIVERLAGGANRGEIESEHGVAWVERTDLTRGSGGVDIEVRDRVFSLPRPQAGRVVVEGVPTSAGDFVVVVLNAVSDPDPATAAAQELNRVEGELIGDYGRVAFDSYVSALRIEADVVVNSEPLAQDNAY